MLIRIMRSIFFFPFISAAVMLNMLCTYVHAGSPIWTFTPLTATTLSVTSDSTATVQYLVTNQSRKSHVLTMKSITGIRQITSGLGVCPMAFALGSRQSCTLSLEIDGSLLPGNTRVGLLCVKQHQATNPILMHVINRA